MAEQLQTEDIQNIQTFSRQHAGGEVFEAQNIEMAHSLCPVLGKMSIEEAGLLLELGAMGKEQMAAKPDQSEKTARKPVIERVETKAKPDKQPPTQDSHSKIVEEAASSNKQARPVLKAEEQSNAVVEPKDNERSKNIISDTLAGDIHNSFLTQPEASRPENLVTDEAHTEPGMSAVHKEIPHAKVVSQAEPIYPSPGAEDAFVVARKVEENRRRAEEAIKTAVTLPETREATIQTIGPELASDLAIDKMDFINLYETVGEENMGDTLAETVLPSLEGLLYETIEKQPEPELNLVNLPETAEAHEERARLEDDNLLGEGEVILLMAELEQGKAAWGNGIQADRVGFSAAGHAAESQAVISVPELPTPVGEIEATITQLAEALELTHPGEPTEAYQILEEIIALPASLETAAAEPAVMVEERLEELFIELFEETAIEYTPELIVSFIKLTQAHYLEELLETAKEEEAQGLPDEIGTREFLQKLKHGLSNMKQTAIHFYEIGKSVLRLYGLGSVAPDVRSI